MDVDEILKLLAEKNIDIWVENDKLKYKAPAGIFSDEIKSIVQSKKKELIETLRMVVFNDKEWPLSLNQQSLWFVNYVHPDTSAYNVAVSFYIKSHISNDIIQKAFDGIVQKYSMLRNTFELKPGNIEPVQKINSLNSISVNILDTRAWTRDQLNNRIDQDYRIPFDLAKDPLIRLSVYRESENCCLLLFVLHHIVCDAFSLNLMLNDFFMFCNRFKTNLPVLESETIEKVQYKDFIIDQKHFLNDQKESESAINFWKAQLESPPVKLNLPYDKPYPDDIKYNGSSVEFILNGLAYNELRDFARKNKVKINSIMMSVFEITLLCLSGQNEFLYGLLSSGRINRKLTGIFGYLVNPLVKRVSFHDSYSFMDYLKKSNKKTLEIFNYQNVPFSYIVEKFSNKRDKYISPIFQVLYNYINYHSFEILNDLISPSFEEKTKKIGQLEMKAYPINQQEGQFELTLEIIESAEQLYCKLKYHTDLFENRTAEKIIKLYNVILNKITSDPGVNIQDLFEEHKWNSSLSIEVPSNGILLSSNFTIDNFTSYFNYWLEYLNLKSSIITAPYDQVFQMLLDSSSLLHQKTISCGIFFISLDKWGKNFSREFDKDYQSQIQELSGNFVSAIEKSQAIQPKNIFIVFTDYHPNVKKSKVIFDFYISVENKIINMLAPVAGVKTYASREIYDLYPVSNYYQDLTSEIANMPYTDDYSMALSTFAVRKMFITLLKPFKVIITDCDNTLWKGVSAEIGWQNLLISEQMIDYQRFLKAKKNEGMLLCIASKNSRDDVETVFTNHKDMILNKDDIVIWKVNWNSKAENIGEIASELNLGLDSFIFIDDNIVECEEVRSKCPGVLVLQFFENNVTNLIKHIWPLDNKNNNSEKNDRTGFYQSEVRRKQLLNTSYDFRQFLKDLNLSVNIKTLKNEDITRASELTYRVNQFNFSGKNLNNIELSEMLNSQKYILLSINAKDRFSDYGMVGFVVIRIGSEVTTLEHFYISCRALGKGIEYQIMAHIGKLLFEKSICLCEILYYPTSRNKPVELFLSKIFKTMPPLKKANFWTYKIDTQYLSYLIFNPEDEVDILSDKKNSKSAVSNTNYDMLIDIYQNLDTIEKIKSKIKQWHLSLNLKLEKSSHKNRIIEENETELQSQIKKLWIQILNHENFSINDNFFDIGGKSILIPSLILAFKQQLNLDLLMIDLFKYPTIKALSDYISNNNHEDQTPKLVQNINKTKIQSFKNKIKNARQREGME